MSLRDEPRPVRSLDLDENALRELVECSPHKSTRELTLDIKTSKSTICWYLKLEKDRKRDQAWCFGFFILVNKDDSISIVTSHFSKQNIMKGEENQVFYENV